jgi:hypothetical protein
MLTPYLYFLFCCEKTNNDREKKLVFVDCLFDAQIYTKRFLPILMQIDMYIFYPPYKP